MVSGFMKKFHICNHHNCYTRTAESQRVYKYLIANGYTYTKDFRRAELTVVFTCANMVQEEDSSVRNVRYYAAKQKSGWVVATGCLAAVNPGRIRGIENVRIVPPAELERFDNLIDARIPYKELAGAIPRKFFPIAAQPNFRNALVREWKSLRYDTGLNWSFLKKYAAKLSLRRISAFIRQYWSKPAAFWVREDQYFLQIAMGCADHCSHCAIKRAIGKVKSRPIRDIRTEFEEALRQGHTKICLTSEDNGCYGVDVGKTIVDLLHNLCEGKETEDFEFHLAMNPYWFVKYFSPLRKFMKANPSKVAYLRLPIESGSNRILKMMSRRYQISEVQKRVLEFRQAFPHLAITTNIIVGFPAETEEDFNQTLSVVKSLKFNDMTINQYSDRPNTRASELHNAVPSNVSYRRICELAEVQKDFGTAEVCIH